jgi:hypothetical protein
VHEIFFIFSALIILFWALSIVYLKRLLRITIAIQKLNRDPLKKEYSNCLCVVSILQENNPENYLAVYRNR